MESADIALALVPNLRNSARHALLAHFGNAQAVITAPPEALQAFAGVGKTLAKRIHTLDLRAFEKQLKAWQARGVAIIPFGDARYPSALTPLPDAPAVLFALGKPLEKIPLAKATSIVGTRKPLPRLREIAHFFAFRYAQMGHTVVSGLAVGVDRVAHEGALAGGGQTVAVLGSGVLNVYPAVNAQLAQRIQAHGTLLCECAPDAPVSVPRLVARNRLMSALSQQLMLIESAEDGGAMHAVRFAFAQGRTVLALNIPATGNQVAIVEGAVALDVNTPL